MLACWLIDMSDMSPSRHVAMSLPSFPGSRVVFVEWLVIPVEFPHHWARDSLAWPNEPVVTQPSFRQRTALDAKRKQQ
jgi:hypothetical protein